MKKTFKELMNKIEKDDEEYDEDGNVIVQGPRFNAKEVQNFGMPSLRNQPPTQNGFSAPDALPHGMKNFDIRIQNVSLNSLPNKYLPDNISASKPNVSSSNKVDPVQKVDPVPDSGNLVIIFIKIQ